MACPLAPRETWARGNHLSDAESALPGGGKPYPPISRTGAGAQQARGAQPHRGWSLCLCRSVSPSHPGEALLPTPTPAGVPRRDWMGLSEPSLYPTSPGSQCGQNKPSPQPTFQGRQDPQPQPPRQGFFTLYVGNSGVLTAPHMSGTCAHQQAFAHAVPQSRCPSIPLTPCPSAS